MHSHACIPLSPLNILMHHEDLGTCFRGRGPAWNLQMRDWGRGQGQSPCLESLSEAQQIELLSTLEVLRSTQTPQDKKSNP